MDNIFSNILGEGALPEEMLTSLQEAFDKKVAEAREEAEMAIRDEFAARYEHDKANLVEAMERMLTDVITKTETAKADELAKLHEARLKLESAITESKALYKKKIREHLDLSQSFVTKQLAKNIKSLTESKKKFNTRKRQLGESFEAVKTELLHDQAARIKKIDEFVVRQVKRELEDFEVDRRALNEQRLKLVTESKAKLKETQTRFVRESARKVEARINESLKREMVQLHEDLERNRQNSFGRRIFEAVAAEFMTSYLAEGTEIRKLQHVLESTNQELAAAKTKLSEHVAAAEAADRKVKLAEQKAARTAIMTELLSNLRGEKKQVMESMLETVKTDHLRAAFDRLLPVVLSEGKRSAPAEKRPVLSEKPAPTRRLVSVTGDKNPSPLREGVEIAEDRENGTEIGAIVRLAGIRK
jgi:hypothetical protein